jgi:hypothetical protein
MGYTVPRVGPGRQTRARGVTPRTWVVASGVAGCGGHLMAPSATDGRWGEWPTAWGYSNSPDEVHLAQELWSMLDGPGRGSRRLEHLAWLCVQGCADQACWNRRCRSCNATKSRPHFCARKLRVSRSKGMTNQFSGPRPRTRRNHDRLIVRDAVLDRPYRPRHHTMMNMMGRRLER